MQKSMLRGLLNTSKSEAYKWILTNIEQQRNSYLILFRLLNENIYPKLTKTLNA